MTITKGLAKSSRYIEEIDVKKEVVVVIDWFSTKKIVAASRVKQVNAIQRWSLSRFNCNCRLFSILEKSLI